MEDVVNGNVLFASRAQGMGKNGILISLFKDFAEYSNYFQRISGEYSGIIEGIDSMLVDLKGPLIKSLSLRDLVIGN